jgi:hypothetical protein
MDDLKRAVWEAYRVYWQQLEPYQRAYHGVPKRLCYSSIAPYSYFVHRLHKRALFRHAPAIARIELKRALASLVADGALRLLTSQEKVQWHTKADCYRLGINGYNYKVAYK